MNYEKLKRNCTACGACILLCPTKSITFQKDKEGFDYIHVNPQSCVNCKLCETRCPQNRQMRNQHVLSSYAVIGKNNKKIKKSSSGGVFITIADWIIEHDGIVFGTKFNENFEAVQVSATTKKDLIPMQGSKYVQSSTKNVYREISHSLRKYKYVLYIGTPCQVAGLYAFLGEEPENLFTIDLICHGIPSPLLFQNYIHWLEKREKETVKKYSFRNKSMFNRTGYILRIDFGKRILWKDAWKDPYCLSFLQGVNFRENCYQCRYSNLSRMGDITIGDLDGIDKVCPQFYPWKAVSTCLLNNEKALQPRRKVLMRLRRTR